MNFEDSILHGLSNKKWLSELIRIETHKLRDIRGNFVVSPFIKTVNGKNRELYNPSLEHKGALKRIYKILSHLDIPDYIVGGVVGRSYVSNVEAHKENFYGIIVDIADFFPSTDGNRVYRFFKCDMRQPSDIAKILTDLTTVQGKNGIFLPQGYPTSPILSFLAYRQMYAKLSDYAKNKNLIFTAYYDDLTFSSKFPISKKCKKEVIAIIESFTLNVNRKKSRLTKLDHTKITGCVILDNQLKAPRKLQKESFELYQDLGRCEEYSRDEVFKMLKMFIGKISAIQLIEKDRRFPNYERRIKEVRDYLQVDH